MHWRIASWVYGLLRRSYDLIESADESHQTPGTSRPGNWRYHAPRLKLQRVRNRPERRQTRPLCPGALVQGAGELWAAFAPYGHPTQPFPQLGGPAAFGDPPQEWDSLQDVVA